MDMEEVDGRLREGVPGGIVEVHRGPYSPHLVVNAEKIRDVSLFLRDDDALRFDYLTNLSGLDTGATLCTAYRVLSFKHKRWVCMRAYVPREKPVIDTVSDIWPVAGWFERESYDLLGIEYRGNPDLRRILLPEDWEGHPLRKDYVDPLRYQDIDNTRDYGV